MHFHVMTNYYTQIVWRLHRCTDDALRFTNVWVGSIYRGIYEEVCQILQVLVNYMRIDIVICTGAKALIGTCVLYYVL